MEIKTYEITNYLPTNVPERIEQKKEAKEIVENDVLNLYEIVQGYVVDKRWKPNKVTQVEKLRRINLVEELLLIGFTRHDLIYTLVPKFKCYPTAIRIYIDEAQKRWRDDLATNEENLRYKFVTQFQSLYRKALKDNNIKEARECLKETAKMLGITPAEKIDNKLSIEMVWVDKKIE